MPIPVVSVIIPVYNAEKYLRTCLDSAVNQTLKDIEIILVDDGSTDSSPYIIDEYALKDSRIRAIHQQNKGGSCACNAGIACAQGEYLGFMDCDDAISPDMYETMHKAAKDYNADIVTTGYARCDENLEVIRTYYPLVQFNKVYGGEEKLSLLEESHANKLLLYAWRTIYKRKMVIDNKILFAPDIQVGFEVLFNLYALYASKRLVALKKAFYFYRDNPNSITRRRYKPYLEKSLETQYEKKVEFYKKHNILDRCSKGLYKSASFNLLPMLLSNAFAKNASEKARLKNVKSIINSRMIAESLNNIPFINRNLPQGKQFIIMASKLKFYGLLRLFYLYKHGIRFNK